ncbi:LPS export ABC transporter periplasmic protein LptC [Coralliovum pocilloporae]|uniref:LPS export ABC transporter periplasmic protein LptC n=1 Tax=Coralliovum pocilloporae TaxID=3066369 RepID=UPI003306BC2F
MQKSDNIIAGNAGWKSSSLMQALHQLRQMIKTGFQRSKNRHAGKGHEASLATLAQDRRQIFEKARRHSRRVRRLRFWLPISSALIIVLFIGFSYVSKIGPGLLITAALLSQGGLTMDNPKLNGFVDGRAYHVEAKQARQSLDNPNVIDLDTILAKIDMDDGLTVSFTAGRGLFDTKKETLALDQSITIESSQGHAGRLESADIDLKAGKLTTNGSITLSLPDGRLEAGHMSVRDEGRTVIFDQGVRISILPIGNSFR